MIPELTLQMNPVIVLDCLSDKTRTEIKWQVKPRQSKYHCGIDFLAALLIDRAGTNTNIFHGNSVVTHLKGDSRFIYSAPRPFSRPVFNQTGQLLLFCLLAIYVHIKLL